MMPLALILRARGHDVAGSDRSRDQGRFEDKFSYLEHKGIQLFPQNGSGVSSPAQIYVDSGAVERDKIPDSAKATNLCWRMLRRPALLAELFNTAEMPIGVAGTSGKSTTTAMIAWILHDCGASPTVVNGAVMKNFATDGAHFSSSILGEGSAFVSELDESDGSIDLYAPKIAVLNNIAPDHKSIEELRQHFNGFVDRAEHCVLNLDNQETARIAGRLNGKVTRWSLIDTNADLFAADIKPSEWSISFSLLVNETGQSHRVRLGIPGRYNVANAVAAIAAADRAGIPIEQACASLATFSGTKRRFENVGEAKGVTVIDDFAHNPDKIAAMLKALRDFPGRLLIMFQPQGFGPIRNFRDEFTESFQTCMADEDILVLAPPANFGGTVDTSFSSPDLARMVAATGRHVVAPENRDACRDYLLDQAKPGDRIVIMGARDDSLTAFAQSVLAGLR